MRSPILPSILLVLAIAACGPKADLVTPDSPLASDFKLLERQVASLRLAIADAKRQELLSPSDVAVSVSEEAVQKAVSQALPIERPVGADFRARIDRASVSFSSMQGAVRLEGRVWTVKDPGTYADLALIGGIPEVEMDEKSGMLTARIVLDGWDVQRAAAAGAEMAWVRDLVALLGERGLSALRDLVPAVRIPVGLERAIDLPGLAGGAVTIPAGRLPLEVKVTRVLPLSGRLWAMIRVTSSGWEAAVAAKPSSKRGGPARSMPDKRREAASPPATEPAENLAPLPKAEVLRRVGALKSERRTLQEALRSLLPKEARLMDAPQGDVLIGLPAALVEAIVSEALLGPLRNVPLSLKDVAKVERADDIQTKTFFGTMTLGHYAFTVDVQQVNAILKPKTPTLSFGANRIAVDLPVSVEAGEVKAKLIFRWDGQNLAGVVCGDLSGEHDVRATVPTVLVRLRGRFDVAAVGEKLIVKPRIAPVDVAFTVEPMQGTWDFIDNLIESQSTVCEAALRKAAVGQKVRDLVSRGFKVTLPAQNWLHSMALPISFRDTFDVQGTSAGLAIIPAGVSITNTRIWYGANVTVRSAGARESLRPSRRGRE